MWEVLLHRPSILHLRPCILALLLLLLAYPALAAPGSWTQTADLPSPTSTPVACVVDGILYVIGGHYPYTNALATVWAYDPATNGWTRKADLPTARRFAAAAVVDGMIYVVGGSSGTWPGTRVLPVAAYNPRTDTWTNGANIPTAPSGAGGVCRGRHHLCHRRHRERRTALHGRGV